VASPRTLAVSSEQGPSVGGVQEEPLLEIQDIQGNVLVGFNKDHQTLLFFEITEALAVKRWLRVIAPHITTSDEALAFARLFRAMRSRRGIESGGLIATWVNIAFTRTGIEKLTSSDEVERFQSDAFKIGMAPRAGLLGDPTDAGGQPLGWVVGADGRCDVLLIVASDSASELSAEVSRIKDEIEALQETVVEGAAARGLRLIFEQQGDDLEGDLAGHEHFGFKDGISQPGVRGRVSAGPHDFLTPRLIDPQDPLAPLFARPGQPLIWPGQFLLGEQYPVQNTFDPIRPQANRAPEPPWAANGSFLVFRRLRQDVPAFWRFMHDEVARLVAKHPSLADLTPERLASLFVGRWPSGAPIMREPLHDNPDLGDQKLAANNFQFTNATNAVALIPSAADPADTFPMAPADADGSRCPFASHIRKVNTRDDTTDQGGPERSLPKRVLRRGIPYGTQLETPLNPGNDRSDRGLLFLSYQASIESQFEFLTTDWINSTINPRGYPGDVAAGHDPLIGQQADDGRRRTFTLRLDHATFEEIALPTEWVITTGGGYFFAPSITALKTVLAS
jgi:Dyp-type peroxidase family